MLQFNNKTIAGLGYLVKQKWVYAVLTIFCCIVSDSTRAQELELQAVSSVDCGASELCMMVQVRSADATDIRIGTSSILFSFDPGALIFTGYTPVHFDASDLCNGGSPAWAVQTYSSVDGFASMTAILDTDMPEQSCPVINDQGWTDVGELCFTILNSNIFPDLKVVDDYTHFNSNMPDNGEVIVPLVSAVVYHATCAADSDSDGIANLHDNCTGTSNPLQEDSDNDGIGDACDPQCNFVVDGLTDLVICQGSEIELTVLTEEGIPPFSYLWSTGDTTGSINVVVSSDQIYHVTMTDASGCVGMSSTDVEVTSGGISGVVIYDLDNSIVFDTIHEGDTFYYSTLPLTFNFEAFTVGDIESVAFVVEGAQYDVDYENSAPYRYPGDFNVVEPVTGNYVLTVTTFSENNLNGVSCDEQILNYTIVNDCATLNLPDVVPLCLGETVTINSGVQGAHGAYQILWSNGMVGDSITITPAETFYLVAEVADQSNCTVEASTEVHVTSADIVTLLIINADTQEIFDTVYGGEMYHIDSFPNNYYLEAIPIAGNTQSVGFDLYGDFGVWGRTDNQPPYKFPSGNIDFWIDNFTMTVAAWDGDWRTGYSCGSYSFSFQVIDYDPSCNYVTNTLDSGVGSLPYALGCAQWWQTVFFDPAVHHDTIVLTSNYGIFNTGCDLSSLKEHEVYIKAEGTPYALYIESGTETRIDGVHIISGTAAQGAGIYNEGEVTLENVTVMPHPGMSTEEPVFNLGTMHVRGTLDVKEE